LARLESGGKKTPLTKSTTPNVSETDPSQDTEYPGEPEINISCSELPKVPREADKRVKVANEALEGAREATNIKVTTERANSLKGANEAGPSPRCNNKKSATVEDK